MEELTKQIAELIATINKGANGAGEQLQRIAPDAWRLMVKQVTIEAWSSIIFWTSTTALLLLASRITWNLSKRAKSNNNDEGEILLTGASGALLVVSVILFLCELSSSVPRLINPEFYAASAIIERITGR